MLSLNSSRVMKIVSPYLPNVYILCVGILLVITTSPFTSIGNEVSEDFEEIKRRGRSLNDDLMLRSKREAEAGAKIIIWGESNAFTFKEDEPDFIDEGISLARSQSIYLGMGLATWNPGSPNPLENKIVLITPEGDIAWAGLKANPVPGAEASVSARDEGNHARAHERGMTV